MGIMFIHGGILDQQTKFHPESLKRLLSGCALKLCAVVSTYPNHFLLAVEIRTIQARLVQVRYHKELSRYDIFRRDQTLLLKETE